MKALASLAILGLVSSSEDNELYGLYLPQGNLRPRSEILESLNSRPTIQFDEFQENELVQHFFGKLGALMDKNKYNILKNVDKKFVQQFNDEEFASFEQLVNDAVRIKTIKDIKERHGEELKHIKSHLKKVAPLPKIFVNHVVQEDAADDSLFILGNILKDSAKSSHEIQDIKEILKFKRHFDDTDDEHFFIEEIQDDDLFQVCINFRGGRVCHNK